VEVETVETGGRVHGVPATFCHILPGFCHILPTGRWNVVEVETVETGGRAQGVTGWSRDSSSNLVLSTLSNLSLVVLPRALKTASNSSSLIPSFWLVSQASS